MMHFIGKNKSFVDNVYFFSSKIWNISPNSLFLQRKTNLITYNYELHQIITHYRRPVDGDICHGAIGID